MLILELLIYSRTPSKLGDVGQIPHTFFIYFFFYIQTYNNTPTPKLLTAVRVVELLIYSRKPSKLGDVGQSAHTCFMFFFFITHKHKTTRQIQNVLIFLQDSMHD